VLSQLDQQILRRKAEQMNQTTKLLVILSVLFPLVCFSGARGGRREHGSSGKDFRDWHEGVFSLEFGAGYAADTTLDAKYKTQFGIERNDAVFAGALFRVRPPILGDRFSVFGGLDRVSSQQEYEWDEGESHFEVRANNWIPQVGADFTVYVSNPVEFHKTNSFNAKYSYRSWALSVGAAVARHALTVREYEPDSGYIPERNRNLLGLEEFDRDEIKVIVRLRSISQWTEEAAFGNWFGGDYPNLSIDYGYVLEFGENSFLAKVQIFTDWRE